MIYFCYGIHHSAEGALARSSPETEMSKCSRNSEASPEKEAFLSNHIDDKEDDEDL